MLIDYKKHELKGKTITLKIRYADFKKITRSRSFDDAVNNSKIIYAEAIKLLDDAKIGQAEVRLLGITLSKFNEMVIVDKTEHTQLEIEF